MKIKDLIAENRVLAAGNISSLPNQEEWRIAKVEDTFKLEESKEGKEFWDNIINN